MTRFFIFLLAGFRISLLQAAMQPDTMLVYDVAAQSTNTLLPVSFNSTVAADHTSFNVGSMGTSVNLSLFPPAANVFVNSSFTQLARAGDVYNVTAFPFRTAVSLRAYKNATIEPVCSGMIVGPCLVLTSASCVFDFFNKTFIDYDSLQVFPAFDNGLPNPLLPQSKVKKIYAFKTLQYGTIEDVALLELQSPIGLQTGWTGVGFNTSATFLNNKVFHKFSYPADYPPGDSSKYYNGDTLYYNYGSINDAANYWSVNSSEAIGIRGQGGSTFMYTDNDSLYYSIGLLTFSSNYMHYKIGRPAFYQLKNVMNLLACNGVPLSFREHGANTMDLSLYPNPQSQEAILTFHDDPSREYRLGIINALGQPVCAPLLVTGGRAVIKKGHLPPGIYFLQLYSNKQAVATTKMIVE